MGLPMSRLESCFTCRSLRKENAACDKPLPRETIICDSCAELLEKAADCRARTKDYQILVSEWVKEQLASSGVRPRELAADISQIPETVRSLIPGPVRTSLTSGNIHQLRLGFGLGGPVGCGKSCAVAAVLKHGLSEWAFQNFLEWGPDTDSFHSGGPSVFWADWPEISDYLLRHAVDSDSVDELMAKMKKADILILDDLGKERFPAVKDPNTVPFSRAQLDICIAYRNSQVAPIFWTTNLELKALGEVYGPATFSRLIQDNPIEWLDGDLDNLRIR